MHSENQKPNLEKYIPPHERIKEYTEIIQELEKAREATEERKKLLQEELDYVREMEKIEEKERGEDDFKKRRMELEEKIWALDKAIVELNNLKEEAEEGEKETENILQRMEDVLESYDFGPSEKI